MLKKKKMKMKIMKLKYSLHLKNIIIIKKWIMKWMMELVKKMMN